MKKRTPCFRFSRVSAALVVSLCMTAPAAWAQGQARSFADMVKGLSLVPSGQHDSDMLSKVSVAVAAIQRLELPQANKAINEALQLDARNSHLHFLNGLVYHLQARQGDSQKNELAIEGYQQALRIDQANWIAQEFLGLAYMDLKKFGQAKEQFAEALFLAPDSSVSLYGLMVAAYLTGDAVTACSAADQFQKVASPAHEGFALSSVAVYASCGNFDKAKLMRANLGSLQRDPADLDSLQRRADQRLAQWQTFYTEHEISSRRSSAESAAVFIKTRLRSVSGEEPPLRLAQAFKMPDSASPSVGRSVQRAAPEPDEPPSEQAINTRDKDSSNGSISTSGTDGNDGSPRMALVDVVLVSSQEVISTSKGINLLSALTLQLGSVAGNMAAYSRVISSNSVNNASADVSTAITRAVTVPALSYTLNIANASNSMNEVLARPTLAAMEGMPSEFFSGINLSAGVISGGTQTGQSVIPVDKRFGVKLAVTPVFLANGKVQLKVDAQRTSLLTTSDNPKVAYQLEIAETTANANVVMNLGDTLVLSGLSEKSAANSRDGVPLLQDVPVVQYLFSNKRSNDIQRSVLILITPRAPVYTALSDASQDKVNAVSVNTQILRKKFGFSGNTPSNVEAILAHLKLNELFREFRQADVSLERWDRMQSTGDRLRQALGFLYY